MGVKVGVGNVFLNVQIFTLRSKALMPHAISPVKKSGCLFFFFSGPNPQVLSRDIITILSK